MNITIPGIDELTRRYPGASIQQQPDGSSIVHLPAVPLPPGWNRPSTDVWFVLPIAYPAAQPDCFYVDADLRLAGGQLPKNSNIQQLAETNRLWFSWHLGSWNPNRDNVGTFARFAIARLTDAS